MKKREMGIVSNEGKENKNTSNTDNELSDLDKEFLEFEKTQAQFTPEQNNESESNDSNLKKNVFVNESTPVHVMTISETMKIRMFLGFACFVLSGLNTFLLNMIRGGNVSLTDMLLTDSEKNDIMVYLDSPEILEVINKIPGWVIAVAHVEYMYWNKYSELMEAKNNLKVT